MKRFHFVFLKDKSVVRFKVWTFILLYFLTLHFCSYMFNKYQLLVFLEFYKDSLIISNINRNKTFHIKNFKPIKNRTDTNGGSEFIVLSILRQWYNYYFKFERKNELLHSKNDSEQSSIKKYYLPTFFF